MKEMSDGIRLAIKQCPIPPEHTWVPQPKSLLYLDPKRKCRISASRDQDTPGDIEFVIKLGDVQATLNAKSVYTPEKGYVSTILKTPFEGIRCRNAFKVTASMGGSDGKDDHKRGLSVSFTIGTNSTGTWYFALT